MGKCVSVFSRIADMIALIQKSQSWYGNYALFLIVLQWSIFSDFQWFRKEKKCILLASWEWVYLILWTLDWDVNSTFETSLLIHIMFLEILFEKSAIFRVYWVLYRVDETDHSYYTLAFPDQMSNKIIIFSKIYFCCTWAIKKKHHVLYLIFTMYLFLMLSISSILHTYILNLK